MLDHGLHWVFLLGFALGTFAVVPLNALGFALPKVLVFSITALLCMLLMWMGSVLRRTAPQYSGMRSVACGSAMSRFLLPCLLLYLFVLFLSPLWSVAPLLSLFGAPPRFLGLLEHGVALVCGFIALLLVQEPRSDRTMFLVILVSNAGVVLYGLLQILRLDPLGAVWETDLFLGRTFSTLGHPNVLGQFLLLTSPFVASAAGEERGWKRAMCFLLLLGGLIVLIATASRGALLALAVVTAVLFFAIREKVDVSCLKKHFLLGMLLAILFLGVGISAFRQRFALEGDRGQRSGSVRLIVWRNTMAMIHARPQGYGLETMGIISPRFLDPALYTYEQLTAGVDRAHSQPLDLLVTLGPLGVITFYGFLISLLWMLWRRKGEGTSLAGFAALLGSSVSLLFNFETVVTLVFFWVICGWMLGLLWREDAVPRRVSQQRDMTPWLLVPALLLTIVTTIVSLQWVRARLAMEKAERSFRVGDLASTVRGYVDAHERFRFDRVILIQGGEATLLAVEKIQDAAMREELLAFAMVQLQDLDALTGGRDGMVPLLRAWHAALLGHRALTEEFLRQAMLMEPATVVAHRIAAHSYMLLGDDEKVRQSYERLAALLPSSWRDRTAPGNRILWKENPWLEEVLLYCSPSAAPPHCL